MHLQCKGYKVLFLKGAHYHNKEHAIFVIKQVCCHHMTPYMAGNLGILSWTWIFCNVNWWAGKKLLELRSVTVGDGWVVREEMLQKAQRRVDSSFCCHRKISGNKITPSVYLQQLSKLSADWSCLHLLDVPYSRDTYCNGSCKGWDMLFCFVCLFALICVFLQSEAPTAKLV